MKKKRIVIDVHEKLHEDIKQAALSQNKTMKEFILDMLIRQLLLYKQ